MGTANEFRCGLGREKTKDPLDSAATTSKSASTMSTTTITGFPLRKTVIGGSPAIEFRYRGKADEHDWSASWW